MKAAVGAAVSKNMKVMRFGDNMRNVAVTEGDKVEVQKKLGWEVNTWAVGDLVKEMGAVTEAEIDALMETYRASYDIATDDIAAIRYQAREEIAMKKMCPPKAPADCLRKGSQRSSQPHRPSCSRCSGRRTAPHPGLGS